MTARLLGQSHIQLTNLFDTSAGMSLAAAAVGGICTQARIVSGQQLTPYVMPCSQLDAYLAHLHRRIVVTGNFKSP